MYRRLDRPAVAHGHGVPEYLSDGFGTVTIEKRAFSVTS